MSDTEPTQPPAEAAPTGGPEPDLYSGEPNQVLDEGSDEGGKVVFDPVDVDAYPPSPVEPPPETPAA